MVQTYNQPNTFCGIEFFFSRSQTAEKNSLRSCPIYTPTYYVYRIVYIILFQLHFYISIHFQTTIAIGQRSKAHTNITSYYIGRLYLPTPYGIILNIYFTNKVCCILYKANVHTCKIVNTIT